jgi:DNA-binding CsgD family transcriptional regulator
MKDRSRLASPLEGKLDTALHLLEQLIAIQLYRGGATQKEIGDNLGISIGKVNGLVRGLKAPK